MKEKLFYESPELERVLMMSKDTFATISEVPVDPDPDEPIELPDVPLE